MRVPHHRAPATKQLRQPHLHLAMISRRIDEIRCTDFNVMLDNRKNGEVFSDLSEKVPYYMPRLVVPGNRVSHTFFYDLTRNVTCMFSCMWRYYTESYSGADLCSDSPSRVIVSSAQMRACPMNMARFTSAITSLRSFLSASTMPRPRLPMRPARPNRWMKSIVVWGTS